MEINTKNLLLEDEEILWQGKLNKKLFTSADWFMIPSSFVSLIILFAIRFVVIPRE